MKQGLLINTWKIKIQFFKVSFFLEIKSGFIKKNEKKNKTKSAFDKIDLTMSSKNKKPTNA